MRISLALILISFLFAGCSKMEEKKLTDNKTQQNQNTTPGNPHGNMSQDNQQKTDNTDMASEDASDPQAEKLSKEAFDFESVYSKNKTDENKKLLAEKHLDAGNYLMFKANLNPKKKYGPALKHYNRVLDLEPDNNEAKANKKQIEDIYEMMGRPIPK